MKPVDDKPKIASVSGSEWVLADEDGNEIPDPDIDPDASASGSKFMRPDDGLDLRKKKEAK